MLISMVLLAAATAAGAGTPFTCQLPGRYCFAAAGTFDGAMVGLEMLGPDGSTWIAVKDEAGAIAFTVADACAVLLPAGKYRGTITSPGAATSIYARLDRITD